MMLAYIICSVAIAAGIFFSPRESLMKAFGWIFYILQAVFAGWILFGHTGEWELGFFVFDHTGILFHLLMAAIAPVVYRYGLNYLDTETLPQKRLYNSLLVLLCVAVSGVYFSDNVAVTWIFLEATTLCTAGLIYHRRTQRSLEATWKYIFVCSVGIAIAYMGILLLGGIASHGDFSYGSLACAAGAGNPLFMKIAFLFILVGYSCKWEIFPLYTIGVDGNYAAPAPASAFISTALVNAGFVAVFRMYRVMEGSEIFGWVSNVLVLAGILSVFVAAFFMRRTNHFKRLLSYSTVENMGIVTIGLGVGGLGVYAALFHMAGHTVLKSAMFLQISRVGKTYGHYQISRSGRYMDTDPSNASMLLVTTVLLLAFPPSPLFVSEVMIFKQILMNGQWWLLALTILLLCLVIYGLGRDMLRLCYQHARSAVTRVKKSYGLFIPAFLLVAVAAVAGIWQPEWLTVWLELLVEN